MVVGVLGGIGAGKSTVTRILAELGAETIFADDLAHEALDRPAGRAALLAWLGPAALNREGQVDRTALARRVFSDPRELRRLEEIVHPDVKLRIEEKVKEHQQAKGGGILALDVPLLVEASLAPLCDEIVFVEAGPAARAARTAERGWPAGELERRERRQASLDEKRGLARHVIDNSGTIEETREQVQALWEGLRSAARARDPAAREPKDSLTAKHGNAKADGKR